MKPPQPAPSGAWEATAVECDTYAAKIKAQKLMSDGDFVAMQTATELAAHFRTVSAPGAGGDDCGYCSGYVGVIKSLRTDLAAKDAEIARLAAMVEQMVTRDHVGECVEAAVAEERARSEAFYGDALALGAVIASMRPVVDAAVEWWADTPRAVPILLEAIKTYQHKKPHHE